MRRLQTAFVTTYYAFRRFPGAVELALCFAVLFATTHGYCYFWPAPTKAISLITCTTFATAMFMAAIRWQREPALGRFFALEATFFIVLACLVVLDFIGSHLFPISRGLQLWFRESLWAQALALLWFIGQLVGAPVVLILGIRKRDKAIPGLLEMLKDKRARLRLRAAIILGRIGEYDRAAVESDLVGKLRRWAYDGHTSPVTGIAVPALLDAMNDTDVRVRDESGRALRTIQ
ncbi:MAG: hypothetical protein O3A00_11110 [Planctomycetota bacterium]|nr:hypothetical protein [Planctomycetota bacterium]